jgi:DNA-binding LacI/PurR family transcriptional regulator
LRVPYDISICCFAGIQDVNEYPITAVVVPEAEMSKVGVDCLIDLIKTRKAPGMIPDITPSFFRGETTLPPSSAIMTSLSSIPHCVPPKPQARQTFL